MVGNCLQWWDNKEPGGDGSDTHNSDRFCGIYPGNKTLCVGISVAQDNSNTFHVRLNFPDSEFDRTYEVCLADMVAIIKTFK